MRPSFHSSPLPAPLVFHTFQESTLLQFYTHSLASCFIIHLSLPLTALSYAGRSLDLFSSSLAKYANPVEEGSGNTLQFCDTQTCLCFTNHGKYCILLLLFLQLQSYNYLLYHLKQLSFLRNLSKPGIVKKKKKKDTSCPWPFSLFLSSSGPQETSFPKSCLLILLSCELEPCENQLYFPFPEEAISATSHLVKDLRTYTAKSP